ncbi:MAG: hypothetical protein UZ05_CHB002002914 [Chlorobi bacterium OLB5]|nr:MAG: hypothetical protein UZ05_CHB002002914 [Chlorobi bacterium OLB5]
MVVKGENTRTVNYTELHFIKEFSVFKILLLH